MTLADILKQLDALKAQLVDVKRAQQGMTDEAEQLKKRYSSTYRHVTEISEAFRRFLPTPLLKLVDAFDTKTSHIVKLNSHISELYQGQITAIGAAQNAYDGLLTATAKYQAQMMRMSDTSQDSVLALQELHEDSLSAQKKGQYKLAESLRTAYEDQLQMSAEQVRSAVQSWHGVIKYRKEMLAAKATVSKLGTDLKTATQESAKFAKNTSSWLPALERSASLVSNVKLDLLVVAATAALKSTLNVWHYVNSELINANSNLQHRLELIKANYAVDAQLGAGYANIAAAQAALLRHGQKQAALDARRLKSMTMLNVGLGVSVDAAADLSLFAELTGNNFEDVGNALAVVINRTQLTGTEAAKLAGTIAHLQRSLGLTAKSLPEIATAMGVLEGAAQSFGAQEGTLGRMVEKFSKLEGIGNAVMFGGTRGIISKEDFADVDKYTQMVKNTGDRLRALTGGDPVRVAVMAPMLGQTAEDARAIMQLTDPANFPKYLKQMKDAQALRKDTDALERRYMEQTTAAGESWKRLKASVMTLVHAGLTPLLSVLNSVFDVINDGLVYVNKFIAKIAQGEGVLSKVAKGAAVVFSTIVGGLVTFGIFRAGRALATLGMAALRWSGIIGGASITRSLATVASNFLRLGGLATRATTFAGIGRALARAGTTLGPAVMRSIMAIPWGTVGRFIGQRILLPISAILGAFNIFKLGYVATGRIKAASQEKSALKALDEQGVQLRQKYHIPAGEDPIAWLKKNRAALSATQPEPAEAKPAPKPPYQSSVLPPQPKVEHSSLATKAAEQALLGQKFDTLARGLQDVQKAVTAGSTLQTKALGDNLRTELSVDQLHRENDLARSRSTVYGLEFVPA